MLYLENFIGNRITNLDGAKPSKWRAMIRTERRIWASDSASLHLCVASQVAMTSVQLTIGAYRKVKSLISQRFQGIQYVGLEPVKA